LGNSTSVTVDIQAAADYVTDRGMVNTARKTFCKWPHDNWCRCAGW